MSSTIYFGAITDMENNTSKAVVTINEKDNVYLLKCTGVWTLNNIADAASALKNISQTIVRQSNVSWDVSLVKEFDSVGVILLLQYVKIFKEKKCVVDITGANAAQEKIFMLFQKEVEKTKISTPERHLISDTFEKIGKKTVSSLLDSVQFISFLGKVLSL